MSPTVKVASSATISLPGVAALPELAAIFEFSPSTTYRWIRKCKTYRLKAPG